MEPIPSIRSKIRSCKPGLHRQAAPAGRAGRGPGVAPDLDEVDVLPAVRALPQLLHHLVDVRHLGRVERHERAVQGAVVIDNSEHVALVKGIINKKDTILVRVHALDLLSDVLGDQ